jgi:hypothetical protein
VRRLGDWYGNFQAMAPSAAPSPAPLFEDLLKRVGKTAKGRLSARRADLARTAKLALAETRGEVLFELVKDGIRFADLLAKKGAEPQVIVAVHTTLLDPMVKRLGELAAQDRASGRKGSAGRWAASAGGGWAASGASRRKK